MTAERSVEAETHFSEGLLQEMALTRGLNVQPELYDPY